jgi:hypothetical protein
MHKSFSALAYAAASGAILFAALLLGSSPVQAHDYYDHDHDGRYEYRGAFMLALDLDYATAFSPNRIDNGGGGAIRIGSEHDYYLVTLIPEFTLDYHNFGAERDNLSFVTGKVGGRVRFLKIVEPGIFAHIGIGNIGGDSQYNHLGAAFDMGVTLDLTIIPLIDLGLHASWNRIFGGYDSGTSYGVSGVHVALVL